MVPHCERRFHVEQAADFSDRRGVLAPFCDVPRGTNNVQGPAVLEGLIRTVMFHVEHSKVPDRPCSCPPQYESGPTPQAPQVRMFHVEQRRPKSRAGEVN